MPRCTKIRGLRSNITHQTFVNSSSVNIKYNITSDLKHQIFFNNSSVNVKHNTTSELKKQVDALKI